jgi:hypothetical protein
MFYYPNPSRRVVEVDEILSEDFGSYELPEGAVTYYEENGEVVTILSGIKAASAIMRPLIENMSDEMRPK